MNFKTLSVIVALLLVASVAFAANPVTVGTSGDFTTIAAAVDSWCAGGSNAGETAPFVINVDPAGTYDESLTFDPAETGHGDIVGDIIIQSATPGTMAQVALQVGPNASGNNSGDHFVLLFQEEYDVTFDGLMFYPSLSSPNHNAGYWFRIDEEPAATPTGDNTYSFLNCLITNANEAGVPHVTSRQDIYTAGYPTEYYNYGRFINFWSDAGEPTNLILDNTSFYGSWSWTVYTRITNSGQVFTVNNCCFGPSDYYQLYIRTNADGIVGDVNITGTDQTTGPDECTLFLQQWAADNHCLYYGYGYALNSMNMSNTIINVFGPDRDVAGSDTRPISGSTSWTSNFTDTIIYNAGIGPIVDAIPDGMTGTYDHLTIHYDGGGDQTLLLGADPGGPLNVTNCIMSGAAARVWTNVAPSSGLNVDYSAYVEDGPDAIGSRTDGTIVVADGSNIVTADPEYISKDFTSADFMDIGNYDDFAGAGSGASFLAGGANVSIEALSLTVGDIPDVGIAPGSTSTPIDLDAYVSSPIYTDDQITWSFSGNTAITVIQDSTSDPQTVAFTASGEVTETITATAADPDAGLPDDSDDIVVRSANLTISGSPDELVIATGECITCIIDLDDWIEVSAFADDQISWTYTGNSDVLVEIANISATQPAHVRLELPTGATVGEDVPSSVDEVITFEGTDPNTDSDTEDLTMKKVQNYLDNTNYDFEWNGMVVNTAPIGWSASAIFYGGTSNTVTFGTSEDSYCGSFAGRINVSGLEGGDGATVAGLVSSDAITYGGGEPLQVGDTIALGMNVKRSQDQWFRIVFFRFGFGHFHLENLAATNIGPGSPTGWEKYVLYFTLPGPAGSFFWRIDNIAIDAQLATGDVELLVDNVTLVNYGAETLEDTKVAGAPIGITNKYFNMGTDTETTVVGVGTGTAEWSSTDMPVGWNIATAIDAYQHVDTGYPQYSVVDASSITNVDTTYPQAAELVSKAIDTSLPAGPAMTINVAINDGTNAADPVDERSERHVLTFSYSSPAEVNAALFRAFVIAEDFSRSAEINVNSNYDAVYNRFRPFACHFAPQPWWPPSMIVPVAGVGNVIVRFDNISLKIGNELTAAESTIWIDSAVMNVVQ